MKKSYISLGPAPSEEDCAQLGDPGYTEQAQEECFRFIRLIREKLGVEKGSARLRSKPQPHDFGTYYEVVCWYVAEDLVGEEYAWLCESQCPRTWDDRNWKGFPEPLKDSLHSEGI